MNRKIKSKFGWWQKVCDFCNSEKFMGILIGFSAGLLVMEIMYLICLAKFGYPVNWPLEWPWNYFLR